MKYILITHIHSRSAESSDHHNHLGIQAMEQLTSIVNLEGLAPKN